MLVCISFPYKCDDSGGPPSIEPVAQVSDHDRSVTAVRLRLSGCAKHFGMPDQMRHFIVWFLSISHDQWRTPEDRGPGRTSTSP
ncbi:hypothetical protein TNCV_5011161 [Trichonephila clavipes]|nr:hypothetical protein TNCV_5011161 [Trichonephila clavipes]